VAADWIVGISRITLEMEGVGECQLSVVVTGDEDVRRLNREFAGEDRATDVLSFSLREGEAFAEPDATARLGEVVISYETAERQACDADLGTEDELAHLLVHGILHLLGHDHAEPEEERRMRARERSVLGSVGFAAH
jgi:probable rRNA maturation factor